MDKRRANMDKLKIEYFKTEELTPYAKNPRKNDGAVDAVAKSIEKFGFKVPIVIDSENNIICGHTRLKAAKKLKIESVPCVIADDLTEEQIKAFRLADNKVGELAEWDFDLLGEELDGIFDIDMSEFGFELNLDDNEPQEIVEDEVPEEVETRCKIGDLWILGSHRLICGDSTDPAVIDRLMDGVKADMCFQSPPYNIGKNAQLNDRDDDNKYINYNDDNPEYRELLTATTENAINNSRYVGINIQMLSGNKKDFVLWLSDFREYLCDIAIWYKDNVAPAMARKVMNSAFEFIVFFSRENQSRAIGTNDFRGTVSNVYQSHIQSGNEYSKIHSATFPVSFAGHFIDCFTNKGDTVLDLFGGSGSTLIACEQLNRKCYMCELDEHYCSVIIERWEQFTGKKAVKLN